MSDDPARYPVIFWYSKAAYPRFEEVGYSKAAEIAAQASQASLETPLLEREPSGQFPTVPLETFGEVSGPQATAILSAFLVWSVQNTGIPTSPLLDAASDAYRMWKAGM